MYIRMFTQRIEYFVAGFAGLYGFCETTTPCVHLELRSLVKGRLKSSAFSCCDTMSSGIGSVFLGDRSHHLSIRHPGFPSHISTPPTSPPPRSVTIDPLLALQLRVAWLDALVSGGKLNEALANDIHPSKTVWRQAEEVQTKLGEIAESNDACKKFLKHCESNQSG